jgi:hypothetical protein
MLATDWSLSNPAAAQTRLSLNPCQLAANALPQLCRLVSSRSTVRVVRFSEEEQDATADKAPPTKVAERAKSQKFDAATLSFRIVRIDYLIELPGTPPPVRHS